MAAVTSCCRTTGMEARTQCDAHVARAQSTHPGVRGDGEGDLILTHKGDVAKKERKKKKRKKKSLRCMGA